MPVRKGMFEVRLYYNNLRAFTGFSFPWESIWIARVPWKVAFFVWIAALGKIPTIDNFHKRHILIVVDWCCMCKSSGESIDHLLLHCSMETDIWSRVLKLFGLT